MVPAASLTAPVWVVRGKRQASAPQDMGPKLVYCGMDDEDDFLVDPCIDEDAATNLCTSSRADLTCYRCESTSIEGDAVREAGALLWVSFNVPEPFQADVESWYSTHQQWLLQQEGWFAVQRFFGITTVRGEPLTSLAIHRLRDAAVPRSLDKLARRDELWPAHIREQAWHRNGLRKLYVRTSAM